MNLSSRTLLSQLMRRAVTYTQQAEADGTNAPPENNYLYFWVPPRTYETYRWDITQAHYRGESVEITVLSF